MIVMSFVEQRRNWRNISATRNKTLDIRITAVLYYNSVPHNEVIVLPIFRTFVFKPRSNIRREDTIVGE